MTAIGTRGAPPATVDLNDTDVFVHGDPHPMWRWLRDNDPVHWNPTDDGGFWALTRYDDVHAAYLDVGTFSSAGGTVMGGSYRSERDSATGRMLICSDPPEHRQLRRQVHKAFSPEMLARASEHVRGYLGPALDAIVDDGGGDFATDVARELPAGFLAAMFGLDRDAAGHLLGLTQKMIGHQDELFRGRNASLALVGAQVEIFDMMSELIAAQRAVPAADRPDDLIGILLRASLNGATMPDEEILYNCLNVAVGGNETTPYTASAAIETFHRNPDQYELLLDRPDLIPTAVDEIFRYTSTNAYVQRSLTRDVTIGGRHLAAGDSVTLWNASANRDERVFTDPDRFDITRDPNPQIAFGVGGHRCIGVAAAQLETTVLLEELVGRRLRMTPAAAPDRLRSNFMLGMTRQPVTAEHVR